LGEEKGKGIKRRGKESGEKGKEKGGQEGGKGWYRSLPMAPCAAGPALASTSI